MMNTRRKDDFVEGMLLYLPKTYNTNQNHQLLDIEAYRIAKVGKKYLWLASENSRDTMCISRDRLYETTGSGRKVYRTKQEIMDWFENDDLSIKVQRKIENHRNYWTDKDNKIPLDQLREIAKILNINYLQPIHLNAEKETAV